MTSKVFKTCPRCHFTWAEREVFMADPEVRLIGYQVNVPGGVSGFFLFNHMTPTCSTTMAIAAEEFLDLHRGPVFRQCLAGTPDCPEHCLRRDDLDPCPAECECRFVRDVLQVVVQWPKRAPAAFAAGVGLRTRDTAEPAAE